MAAPHAAFTETDTSPPHRERAKQILAAHPDVRRLFKRDRRSAIWTVLLVGLQVAVGIGLGVLGAPWWAIIVTAYAFGAFANHALFVLIHDYTHNVVFRKANANRLGSIFANIAIVFPAAIGFRNHHLLHHKHLGIRGLDADIPTGREARWVGDSWWRKSLWLSMYWAVQALLRPATVKRVRTIDNWVLLNAATMVAAMAPIVWFFGWWPVAYLFLSTIFSLGVHPVGARWIQEHYVFREGQETYSYYGPLNKLAFNMGYHNEHHDFPQVPWSRLPAVRKAAPEFYDHLYFHRSWTKLLFHVLFSRKFRLNNRIIRPTPEGMKGMVATRGKSNFTHFWRTAPKEVYMSKFKVAIVKRGQEGPWRKYWITSGSGTAGGAPSALGRTEIVEAATVAEAVMAVQRLHPDCTVMLAGGEHRSS